VSSLRSLGGFVFLSFFLRIDFLINIIWASRRAGRRGREPHPALGRGRAGLSHRWGSLKALRLQPAPHLDSPSPRPPEPLFGGCGEVERLRAGAPYGTDAQSPSGSPSRRLGRGPHPTATC